MKVKTRSGVLHRVEIIMRPLRWIIPQRCYFRDNNELVGTEGKGLRTPADVQAAP